MPLIVSVFVPGSYVHVRSGPQLPFVILPASYGKAVHETVKKIINAKNPFFKYIVISLSVVFFYIIILTEFLL